MSEHDEVRRLTDELFRLVEQSQGYFFVSDGEDFETKAEFFERIRGRLAWGRSAVAKMREMTCVEWVKENGRGFLCSTEW